MDKKIILLRALAIISILLHHTLCIYQKWPPELSITPINNNLYSFFSSLFKGIGLTVFTLISGYLLSMQIRNRHYNSFLSFIFKKVKRILLPCLFAGIIYYIIFPQYSLLGDPFNGSHLWYFIMIFMCFMLYPIFNRFDDPFILLLYIIIIALISRVIYYLSGDSIHFRQFLEFYKYVIIFHAGYILNSTKLDKLKKKVMYLIAIFIFLLVAAKPAAVSYLVCTLLLFHYADFILMYIEKSKYGKIIYSVVSSHSFNIYIIHQFIINYLVCKFTYSHNNSFYMLPLSFIFILLFSISLSLLWSKIKLAVSSAIHIKRNV